METIRTKKPKSKRTFIMVMKMVDENISVDCWSNLKKACKFYKWSYSTLSKKQLPINYDSYDIYKKTIN